MDFALFPLLYPELLFCKLDCDLPFSEVKMHLSLGRKKKKKKKDYKKEKKPKTNYFFFLEMLDIYTCDHIPDIFPQVLAKSLKVKKCLSLFLAFANSRHLSCLITLHLHWTVMLEKKPH